jgi:hypothetical protein
MRAIGLGLALGAALAALTVWALARLRARGRSRHARRRAARAQAGERDAEALLAGAGYRVVDRQVAHAWRFSCDGEPVEAALRCDLLVEGPDGRLVAEVKTGAAAPRLETAATRRQLLEYQVAYGADGVLLVDAEAGVVRRVEFPTPRAAAEPDDDPVAEPGPGPAPRGVAIALIAAAVGALAGHVLW